MRVEVYYRENSLDGRAKRLLGQLQSGFPWLEDLAIIDVYLVDQAAGVDRDLAAVLFSDSVAQRVSFSGGAAESGLLPGWSHAVEVGYKPGVTDTLALTARETVKLTLGKEPADSGVFQTARLYLVRGSSMKPEDIEDFRHTLFNPLIQKSRCIIRQEWDRGERFPDIYPHHVPESTVVVESIPLEGLDDDALVALSKKRLLALTLEEMTAVKDYFSDEKVREERNRRGMGADPTDVELEMIAQTWSEHCKHKIFNATIDYHDETDDCIIDSLFASYIKKTTDILTPEKPFLKSVFHDNSGVIQFDEDHLLCFKAETHNSPSALDPYGGSITGIVGVNRDIIGTGKGAKPIFNTNVLCFGEPDTPEEELPAGLLHPKRVLDGVHHGIIDGGNQSGIPVVAGAFLFDESYTGKPLVFCGTGGILPAELHGEGGWIKHISPGDKAVMVGGRIGKDGIHGATFSSQALDDDSPTSAVQIGDPITQKKTLDFILEARDKNLYSGITDNGAGGLSSSLGEMAESSGGVRIDLEQCPLKYEGLAPWEILVSESQERMSLSVPPEKTEAFLSLADKRDVEATVVGEFTDSGYVEVFHAGILTACLSLEFLHRGLPVMHLEACWNPPHRPEVGLRDTDLKEDLLALLREPNIASKEHLVRQYDHEVQAQSIIKPFTGAGMDAPSDGAVLKPVRDSYRGITVTHGICPRYGDIDTYQMALCAVDEAYRAHIACGGNPDLVSGLDNFCWPDPVESEQTPDGQQKLAQLVRACRGLKDACVAYGIPLISGKDSMKNDASIGGKKVSVRPTLLVSLMGIIEDVRKAVSTDFKRAGDGIFLLGNTRGEMGGTVYEKIKKAPLGTCPKAELETAIKLYRAVSAVIDEQLVASCHDLSDGGLGVALAESALGGRLGAAIQIPDSEKGTGVMEDARFLFCETPSRFIVSVAPHKEKKFSSALSGLPHWKLGEVTENNSISAARGNRNVLSVSLEEIEAAWKQLGKER